MALNDAAETRVRPQATARAEGPAEIDTSATAEGAVIRVNGPMVEIEGLAGVSPGRVLRR